MVKAGPWSVGAMKWHMYKASLKLGLLLLSSATVSATTYVAASANYADVLVAYNAAANGDTVQVPTGTVNWTNTLTVAKAITIKGNGRANTIIRNTRTTSDWYQGGALFYVTASGTPRITGMTLDGNWTTYNSAGGVGIVLVGAGVTRVDNCQIQNCFFWGIYAAPGSPTRGLIDHNIMLNNCIDFSCNSDNHTSWTRALDVGTTNSWVLEDNYFAKTRNDRWIPVVGDGHWGARYCYRFNVLSNTAYTGFDQVVDAHGNQGSENLYGPASLRGVVFFESYNNLWSTIVANRVSHLRGGTQIHYNNQVTAGTSQGIGAYSLLYQVTEEDGYRAGNPVLTAWPGADGITNSYFFANSINGSTSFGAPGGVWWQWPGTTPCPVRNCSVCLCPPSTAASDNLFIEQNRDFFLTQPGTNFYRPLSYPHPRIKADNDPAIPSDFALSTPADLATGVSTQPTLTWQNATGETGYRVLLANNIFFASPIVDTTVVTDVTSYAVPGGLLSNSTTYYWIVRATSANGVQAPSAPFVFTTGSGAAVPGSFQVQTNAYSVNEDTTPLVVTVQRVGGTDGAVSVQYETADDTAIASDNYTAVSGTLNWGDGDGVDKTVNVPIIDNGVYQSSLQFTFTIHTPAGGATLGSPSSSTVTVLNVNPPPADPPLMGGLTFHAYEGLITSPALTNASGNFYVPTETENGRVAWRFTITTETNYFIKPTVIAQNPASNSFIVDVDTDPIGSAYKVFSISSFTGPALEQRVVSWVGSGTTNSQFATNVWYLTAGVHTLYWRTREANTFLDEVQILEFGSPVTNFLQWSEAVVVGPEYATPLSLSVDRLGDTNGTVTVNYETSDGTAVAGTDYTTTTGTLTLTDGVVSGTIQVPIIDNTTGSGNKFFYVTLSSPTNAVLNTPVTALAVIEDDESREPAVTVVKKANLRKFHKQ